MPRHANYIPHGFIPAVLLLFDNELAIDEVSFRAHLRDVAATQGLSAVTINAHSTEVGSCTFDEQRRVLEIAQDEIGDKLPLINGVWADGSLEAARIAKMATEGGASALLVFPPAPFTLGQNAAMALAHFKHIADPVLDGADAPHFVAQLQQRVLGIALPGGERILEHGQRQVGGVGDGLEVADGHLRAPVAAAPITMLIAAISLSA